MNSGNSFFSNTQKIQEWLTPGYLSNEYQTKMLSVICLEEIHLCEGRTHLMVYQWRPRQIAVVSILQSQLHSVNGRKASGDSVRITPMMEESLLV